LEPTLSQVRNPVGVFGLCSRLETTEAGKAVLLAFANKKGWKWNSSDPLHFEKIGMKDTSCSTGSGLFSPWADVPFSIHSKIARSLGSHSIDPNDPKGAAVIKYLNQWVDYIDEKMRSGQKRFYDLTRVPKPHVAVTRDERADGVAVSAPVCVNVPIRFGDGKPQNPAPGVSVTPDRTSAGSEQFNPNDQSHKAGEYTLRDKVGSDDCEQRDLNSLEDLEKFNAFLARYTSCKTEIYTDGKEQGIRLRNCPAALDRSKKDRKGNQYDGANKFVVNLESNWITVTTGMLSDLADEKQILSVLAHELNHYYSAHLMAPAGKYGFFFEEHGDRKNPPGRSQRVDPGQWPEELNSLLRFLYNVEPGSIDNGGALAPSAMELAKKGPSPECDKVRNMPDAVATLSQELLDCLETESFSRAVIMPKDGKFGPIAIQKALQEEAVNSVRLHFDLDAFPSSPTNLKEVYLGLQKVLRNKAHRAQELLAREKATSLGQYTYEQDADEKSLWTLNNMGISPYHAVDAILQLGRETQSRVGVPFSPVKSAQECTELFDQKHATWADSDYPYIHLGTTSDPHHQYCYRAKKMFDIAKSNGYITSDSKNLPNFGSWDQIQSWIESAKSSGSPMH
jgi:hypothetical protein